MPAPHDQPRWPETIPWSPRGPAPGRWRSRGDATSWSDLLYTRLTGMPAWADRRRVAVQALGRPSSSTTPTAGAMAQTEILTYPDGSRAVRKTFADQVRPSREYLASMVAERVGATAPAVVKDPVDPEYAVIMGYVHGDPGTVHTGQATQEEWERALYYYAATDAGQRIGLLDVLIGNADRHSENWLLSTELDTPHAWRPDDPLRRPIAIDHSEVFPATTLLETMGFQLVDPATGDHYDPPVELGVYPGFFDLWLTRVEAVDANGNQGHVAGVYGYRPQNPLHPDDVPVLRTRLEALREHFEQENMLYAWDKMMERFEQLAIRAAGTTRMFPDE